MIAKDIMRKDYVRIEKDDRISRFIGQLTLNKQDAALVFDGKKYLGVVSTHSMVKSKIETQTEGVKNLIAHAPHINQNDDLLNVATLMFHSGARILPVMDNDKVLGIVKSEDVIAQLRGMKELKQLKVRDIRHPRAMIVKDTDKLGKVIQMFSDNDITRVPVVDSNNSIVGIISMIDIMEKYLSHPMSRERSSRHNVQTRGFSPNNPSMLALPVKDFELRTDVITADEGTSITDIADLMIKNRISSIIIAKDNEPKSIVTKRDLLEVIMNLKKEEKKNLQFIGFNDLKGLSPEMKEYAVKLCAYYAEKIAYLVDTIHMIHVHFKVHKVAGKKDKAHKYAVHVRVECPNAIIVSSKASDWDLPRTIHKAFNDVQKMTLHKFKGDTSYRKSYYRG